MIELIVGQGCCIVMPDKGENYSFENHELENAQEAHMLYQRLWPVDNKVQVLEGAFDSPNPAFRNICCLYGLSDGL